MQDVIDGPLPCMGKSDVEGYFDGPYYEWFRANKVCFYFYTPLFSLVAADHTTQSAREGSFKISY